MAAAAPCAFGTDGVRGRVGEPPMTPDCLVRLGYAMGTVLGGAGTEAILGKDTRLSGYMVESAIEAGLSAAGVDVALTGPLPTSAIALLADEEQAAAGIVISASHNPYHDNGIKVFDTAGRKLSDGQEREIERIAASADARWASEPGKARRIDDAAERYIGFCLRSFPSASLRGMRIVADAANGAAYYCLPETLRRCGAEVIEIGCEPDGRNINVGCGALKPETAAAATVEHGADCAVVLDGDADRLLLVDGDGRVLDGDACLYILCRALAQEGNPPAGIAGTLMSNQALAEALAGFGIAFERAPVGDRHVAALLRAKGWQLGGEPSGHLLQLQKHPTGDGILGALAVVGAAVRLGGSLAQAAASYRPLPQAQVAVAASDAAARAGQLADAVRAEEQDPLIGRIVVRPSGTEPVVRILVEAHTDDSARAAAGRLAAKIQSNMRASSR